MEKNESFKKLLGYLEEQHKVEKENYNEGVSISLVFKLEKSEEDDSLLLNGKPIDCGENSIYLMDLYDTGLDSGIVYKDNIPEEVLKVILPNPENQEDNDTYFDDFEVDDEEGDDSEFNPENEDEFNLDDVEFDFEDAEFNVDDIVNEDLDQLTLDLKSLLDKDKEVSIVLTYNLYQYEGDIFVVTPDGCNDREIDPYGIEFIDLVNKTLGIN